MGQVKIYVDFDDVLCETAQALAELVAGMYGRRVEFDAIRSFDLGISFSLNEEQTQLLMARAHEPGCLLSMLPVHGAVGILSKWHAAGHEVWIVTGRHPDTEVASREWLAMHDVRYSSLYFVDKYGRFGESARGPAVLRMDELPRIGFDMAVDDSPQMIDFLCGQVPTAVAVYDRPWNGSLDLAQYGPGVRVSRCCGWGSVDSYLAQVVGLVH